MVDAQTESASQPEEVWPEFFAKLPKDMGLSLIRNKCDLTKEDVGIDASLEYPVIRISARDQLGIDALKTHLKQCMGFDQAGEDQIIARQRHITALLAADAHIQQGKSQLEGYMAGELLAEELRIAQNHLNEITGEFTSDDLLGKIFSSFCIGK
jgi:tRNA modification GTPase